MVNKISFRNFKIFKNWQTLELKPITILIGKNNSGKSALLKLMTLIEGALTSNQPQPINLVNDDIVIGNEYKDLVYGKFARALELKLYQENLGIQKEDELSVNIAFDINENKPILEYWKLNNELELRYLQNNIYENEKDEEQLCSFAGLHLVNRSYQGKPNIPVITYRQPFNLTTDYIGSMRASTSLL